MKLTSLEIANVLGIARAEIDLSNPVTVITGTNESGKSSIRDAVSMAFLGKPCRVEHKKRLDQLLHDDAPKGRVIVQFGETGEGAEFRIPKGDHSVSEFPGAAYMPYLLDPALFASASADDRRSFLFALTGCKASGQAIRDKLEARGISKELIDEITPELRKGFPAASAMAYDKAKSAKAVWRSITGATWGSNVAEGWKAERPEGLCPKPADMDAIMTKQGAAQVNVEKGTAYVGGLEAKLKAFSSYGQRLRDAEQKAVSLPELKAAQEKAQTDLDESLALLPELEKKLSEMRAGAVPVPCPCCGEDLKIVGGTLVKFEGLKANAKDSTDFAMQVTSTRDAIAGLKRYLVASTQALAQAEAAADAVAAIKAEKVEKVDQAMIDDATAKLARCREQAQELRTEFNTKQELRNQFGKVAETTQKATDAHAEVKAWLEVGDALAPDGIPAEILQSALAPVNQSLAVLSGMCGWKAAVIHDDMSLSYGGRVYELNSESGQWRFDALMALAIAQISDLRLVVLDRFDVLDVKSRVRLIHMLKELGRMDLMHSMILLGTTKGPYPPEPGVGSVWVQAGLAEMVAV